MKPYVCIFKSVLYVCLILSVLSSCSGRSDDSVTYDVTSSGSTGDMAAAPAMNRAKSAPKDVDKSSQSYKLGRDHATRLHGMRSDSDIRAELLDINARAYTLRTRVSDAAADDYLGGMRDYLTEVGDTLGTTLFCGM